jgi:hypothetical protein
MKKSQLRQIIKEEISKVLKENALGPGVPGSVKIFGQLEDDAIDEWRKDPKIRQWTEQGRVSIIPIIPREQWAVWAKSGDKEVRDYVTKQYAW